MSNKRKTGKDYRKDFKDLNEGLLALDAHVTERLKDLTKIYPDGVVLDTPELLKAKALTDTWIESLSTESKIYCIEKIEEWSANQQKVRQLKIE